MANNARAAILQRLRQGKASAASLSALFPINHSPAPAPTPLSQDERQLGIATLSARLTDAHAEVIVTHPKSLAKTIIDTCLSKGGKRLLLGSGVLADALAVVASDHDCPVYRFQSTLGNDKRWLFDDIDVAVTPAAAGVVDVGALLLIPDADHPRLMSLVPPMHVVVVNADRLYANLADALAAHRSHVNAASNVLFISGPSKTADIQQTLAYGAHGPKTLCVIIVDKQTTNEMGHD